jgi:ribonuclease HII
MAWLFGIDEAGYGPNLGPFVMSMVGLRHAGGGVDGDLWQLLAPAVRRPEEPDDGRLAVGDSKALYSTAAGLASLEPHVFPFLRYLVRDEDDWRLDRLWPRLCLTPYDRLLQEPWATGDERLPLEEATAPALAQAFDPLVRACQAAGVELAAVRCVVLFPREFNELLGRHDSKAAGPAWAIRRLLEELPRAEGEPVHVAVDKLGGRNRYGDILQEAFPDRFVWCCGESAGESRYEVVRREGPCTVTFRPRADADCFPVALASMVSKYLREVLMRQFNRFWRQHVPELKPTAGYPGDAARFYDEIAAARRQLGIPDADLWRAR